MAKLKKISKKFLRALGIDYKVKNGDWFITYPDIKWITIKKDGFSKLSKKEKKARQFFQELGLEVEHPMTYSLLHEAGHAVSFSGGRWLTEANRTQYMKDVSDLQDAVDGDNITYAMGMERYYQLGVERDANQEAKNLFDKNREIVKKFDKKFLKKFPIKGLT